MSTAQLTDNNNHKEDSASQKRTNTSVYADILKGARERGSRTKQKLMKLEGGCVDTETIANSIGVSSQDVDEFRKNGKLIGLSLDGKYVYPQWQLTPNGKILDGLEVILKTLSTTSPWTQVAFFLNRSARLGGRTPLSVLKEGNIESVRLTAEAFAYDKPES